MIYITIKEHKSAGQDLRLQAYNLAVYISDDPNDIQQKCLGYNLTARDAGLMTNGIAYAYDQIGHSYKTEGRELTS